MSKILVLNCAKYIFSTFQLLEKLVQVSELTKDLTVNSYPKRFHPEWKKNTLPHEKGSHIFILILCKKGYIHLAEKIAKEFQYLPASRHQFVAFCKDLRELNEEEKNIIRTIILPEVDHLLFEWNWDCDKADINK